MQHANVIKGIPVAKHGTYDRPDLRVTPQVFAGTANDSGYIMDGDSLLSHDGEGEGEYGLPPSCTP